MKIGMIGGGVVAQTLGAALLSRGHEVAIGVRNPSADELAKPRNYGKPLTEWLAETGGRVTDMNDAAAGAEIVFNATDGTQSLAALKAVGAERLAGKILVDVSNPLDFSAGMPPFLHADYSGANSLGEAIQAAFPDARVVKAFNTIGTAAMVTPHVLSDRPDLFVSGNDAEAKKVVDGIARSFGWESVIDLGDISGSRAQEALLPMFMRLVMTGDGKPFGLKVARA